MLVGRPSRCRAPPRDHQPTDQERWLTRATSDAVGSDRGFVLDRPSLNLGDPLEPRLVHHRGPWSPIRDHSVNSLPISSSPYTVISPLNFLA